MPETTETAAAPAKPGWGPTLRTAGIIVAAALVGGVALLPRLLSSPDRAARWLAGAVPGLRAPVRIDGLSLGWFGPLVVEGITVADPDGGERPPLSVARVEIAHGLAGILLSAGDLGRVTIDGLVANVEFDEDRRSNLASLVDPARVPPSKGVRGGGLRMEVVVEDAVLHLAGPWTTEPWESEPIDVRAVLATDADGGRTWTIDPVDLLVDARLEPAVAQGVLAYIAPVLADATRSSGRFSLRIDSASFPVGRPDEAAVAGVLAMHEVVVGPGPLVHGIFAALPGDLPAPPDVRVADESHVAFELRERRVYHEGLEFGLPLRKPGQRLDIVSSGSVGIDDKSLDIAFKLPIPADLPQDRPLLAALAGKQISLGIGGVLGDPRVQFDGSIKATAGAVVTDLIGELRERARGVGRPTLPPLPGWRPATPPPAGKDVAPSPRGATSEPRPGDVQTAGGDETGESPIVDLVAGVLDEVARRRAERKQADAESPPAARPRRGGLLRRFQQPQPVPQPDPSP